MSLRDFNSSSDVSPITLNHEPLGNGSGLGAFHTVNPEEREPNNMPKIIGALAVALMVGTAGAYLYSVSGKNMQPKSVVTAAELPAPAPMAPAPQPVADTAPAADTSATTPVSAPAPEPKVAPVKSASMPKIRTTRTAAVTPSTPRQQAAVIPEPVSPTPSPSDVAANMPSNAPAATMPAAPDSQTAQNGIVAVQPQQSSTPDATAPAPEQATAPAPTQPAPAAQPAQPAPAAPVQ